MSIPDFTVEVRNVPMVNPSIKRLENLEDVTLADASNGQVLTFEDGEWVNADAGGSSSVDWANVDNKPDFSGYATKTGGNAFTGNQTMTGNLHVGSSATPTKTLQVSGNASIANGLEFGHVASASGTITFKASGGATNAAAVKTTSEGLLFSLEGTEANGAAFHFRPASLTESTVAVTLTGSGGIKAFQGTVSQPAYAFQGNRAGTGVYCPVKNDWRIAEDGYDVFSITPSVATFYTSAGVRAGTPATGDAIDLVNRTVLHLQTPVQASFTEDGVQYFVFSQPCKISFTTGAKKSGTGSLSYARMLSGASEFSSVSGNNQAFAAGDTLRITATGVNEFVAVALQRGPA